MFFFFFNIDIIFYRTFIFKISFMNIKTLISICRAESESRQLVCRKRLNATQTFKLFICSSAQPARRDTQVFGFSQPTQITRSNNAALTSTTWQNKTWCLVLLTDSNMASNILYQESEKSEFCHCSVWLNGLLWVFGSISNWNAYMHKVYSFKAT